MEFINPFYRPTACPIFHSLIGSLRAGIAELYVSNCLTLPIEPFKHIILRHNINERAFKSIESTNVDETVAVASSEVIEHSSFVQVGHVSHVIQHEELGRIHLLNRVLLNGSVLRVH